MLYGKQRGMCRESREERADGNMTGQQADHAVEQGEAEGGRERQRLTSVMETFIGIFESAEASEKALKNSCLRASPH